MSPTPLEECRTMTFRELRYLWYSDLFRYTGRPSCFTYLRHLLVNIGYRYTFLMRLCAYLAAKGPLAKPLYIVFRFLLWRHSIRFGLAIPPETRIGSGFYIGHIGGIVVNRDSIIGRNCNMSQGVVLGQANRGPRKGCPVVGDNVYLGPGAKLVGAVHLGDHVAVGANCVVTKDMPDKSVVVGVPGKVISDAGSEGYVERTDY